MRCGGIVAGADACDFGTARLGRGTFSKGWFSVGIILGFDVLNSVDLARILQGRRELVNNK